MNIVATFFMGMVAGAVFGVITFGVIIAAGDQEDRKENH